MKTNAYISPQYLFTFALHTLLIAFLSFYGLYMWGKMEQKPKETETKKKIQRDRLSIASPCSAVKHIEVWLDCTGQFWPPCQTHRCIIMTDCVLESCQKPASVLLPCSPFLSPPFFCIHLSGYCCLFEYVSDSVYNSTWHEFHFNKCQPCICFFSFEEMSR